MSDTSGTPLDDAVERALGKLDLDAKTRLLAGQDMWSLPALPEIGLGSLVVSDGPIGVRGVRWTADDPSIALPSPTALAATWDPALARRTGRLLAQEARRKGVHVLLAPTVNLHRSPLGGRHFEAYSEDPYLTGEIGTGYVAGVQDGGVGTTVKHFVANDAETERFTVDNVIGERALRELYLAPFEAIVRDARPWGVMAAYNSVNGTTMTEHHRLQNEVLREEWGFDGFVVSDWAAARDTAAALAGGLDVAMPEPRTVYGQALARAVREGRVEESAVDTAVRNVLRLAARVGLLAGTPAAVPADRIPAAIDGPALAREIARRSFVLVRNEPRGGRPVLPVDPAAVRGIALIGAAARDARVLGGGSAQVFPAHVVAPLDGLRAALPEGTALAYAVGADPNEELAPAGPGFVLRAVCRDAAGEVLGTCTLPGGHVQWMGGDLPDGVTHDTLRSVEVTGTFTPARAAPTTSAPGAGRLPARRGRRAGLRRDPGRRARVRSLRGDVRRARRTRPGRTDRRGARRGLTDPRPAPGPQGAGPGGRLLARPRRTAAGRDRVDRGGRRGGAGGGSGGGRGRDHRAGRERGLRPRGPAAAGPSGRTRARGGRGEPSDGGRGERRLAGGDAVARGGRRGADRVVPGQEAGAALADVLLGAAEPGGRLPTTWPARLADAPVGEVVPRDGVLRYDEGVFIGYRAWERAGAEPAYPFGHGLGYTDWAYEDASFAPAEGPAADGGRGTLGTLTVRLRNTGDRPGREVVQVYLAAPAGEDPAGGRPARVLAGFLPVELPAGAVTEARIALPRRAAQIWDPSEGDWRTLAGTYTAEVARSVADRRLTVPVAVGG